MTSQRAATVSAGTAALDSPFTGTNTQKQLSHVKNTEYATADNTFKGPSLSYREQVLCQPDLLEITNV